MALAGSALSLLSSPAKPVSAACPRHAISRATGADNETEAFPKMLDGAIAPASLGRRDTPVSARRYTAAASRAHVRLSRVSVTTTKPARVSSSAPGTFPTGTAPAPLSKKLAGPPALHETTFSTYLLTSMPSDSPVAAGTAGKAASHAAPFVQTHAEPARGA
jgi:hypothetical protein